jgi:hypothetical protein
MNWSIVWLEQALSELAAATLGAWGTPVSEQIIQAMLRAETEIQANPTGVGESRPGNARLLIELPRNRTRSPRGTASHRRHASPLHPETVNQSTYRNRLLLRSAWQNAARA